ncbi:hypothetical protein J2S55_008043 [Streptosporangium brasiliense]|uniref:Phosphoribosyl-ATP pyrophosphatase n=1 Tax=Streptosporangium brasiliense TaxID=47480 RepID=A0ABT9RIX4_9ACTN|nr:hypothetical protein [Streptosporangium brasiliense]
MTASLFERFLESRVGELTDPNGKEHAAAIMVERL